MNYYILFRYVLPIILFIILLLIFYYNTMLKKANKVKNAYASLDVMFKKRNDLIPNLVNTVKGYAKHEEECLEKISKIRSSFNKGNTFSLSNEISNTLNDIFALQESYPNLKANENFLKLQKALYDVEEHIGAARRTYNAHVTSFNNFVSVFPNLLFAKLFGFKKYSLFSLTDN